jgi:ubiquinone/menaquinone biosynthesis C-methylase UbiE
VSLPELYERWLVGPVFQPFAEIALDRAGLRPGDRILDIACGTGIAARLALKRLPGSGRIVGVDVSRQMLAVARTIEPGIDWREGNAQALPLQEGERFDVVLCHQGLQFFPDKPAAAREMRRALDRGGRLLAAVWRSLDETPFVRDLHAVAERHLGAFVDRRHSFGDRAALERLIADAGFENVRVESVTCRIRFTEPAMFVRLDSHAVVAMSGGSSSMSGDERRVLADRIAADAAEVVRQHTDEVGLTFELGANLAIAELG